MARPGRAGGLSGFALFLWAPVSVDRTGSRLDLSFHRLRSGLRRRICTELSRKSGHRLNSAAECAASGAVLQTAIFQQRSVPVCQAQNDVGPAAYKGDGLWIC
jgi:hypothetical protein